MTNDRRKRAERAEQMRLERAKADKRRRSLITVAIAVVVVLIVGVGAWAFTSGSDKDTGPLVTPKSLTSDGGIVFDQETATGTAPTNLNPVNVVVYEDFQCPICQIFEKTNGSFLDQQVKAGVISIEYRPISILDSQSNSRYASRALNAAMCVYEDKGAKAFRAFHDVLYANQPKENSGGLPDSKLADFAKQVGATGAARCVTDETYMTWALGTSDSTVKVKDAEGKKVSGTPTIWVDGKAVEGPEQNGQATMAGVADLQKAITAAKP